MNVKLRKICSKIPNLLSTADKRTNISLEYRRLFRIAILLMLIFESKSYKVETFDPGFNKRYIVPQWRHSQKCQFMLFFIFMCRMALRTLYQKLFFKCKIISQQMKNITDFKRFSIILLGLLFLLSHCQGGNVLIIDNQNSSPSVSANYLGCKIWKNGVCEQCSQGYYFDAKGVCSQINQYCRQFNQDAGICQSCYDGYSILNGECVIVSSISTSDLGCKAWSNSKCRQCSQRWFLDQNGKCQKVDDNCRTWDQTGKCLSCYNGYELKQGKCILKISNEMIYNPLCKNWEGSLCVECSYRAFFNKKYICQQVSPNCNTWDKLNGQCLSCYEGYTLANGDCSISSTDSNDFDPMCRKFDWQKKTCLQCSQRSFKNKQGRCQQVSPLCKSYNELTCLSCYSGYSLSNGQCTIRKADQPTQITDPGCAQWDWEKQICLKCSTRYIFNNKNNCIPVSNLCKTFDSTSGACTSCYQGYSLSQSSCILSNTNTNTNNTTDNTNTTTADPNCIDFDQKTKKCLKCSFRYVFNLNGLCVKVSDTCQTWDTINGQCTTCYSGYTLDRGSCAEGSQDPNCNQYNSTTKKCSKCSTRYYLGANGICTEVSAQCYTYNSTTGYCLTCYGGYQLQNGDCVVATQQNQQPQQPTEGCSSWNSQTNQCQFCQNNYCLNQNRTCVKKPQNCRICEFTGGCSKCVSGYHIQNKKCVKDTDIPNNCREKDGNRCKSCNQGAFLFDGVCLTYEQLKLVLDYYKKNNDKPNNQ